MAVTAALSPSNLPQSSTGRFDVNSVDDMQDPEELRSLSAWKVHTPTGDRKGTWSLSVTRKPPDMALRVEKAFGVKMDTLLRMQASYDIAQTRKHEKQIHVLRIHHIAPFTRQEISTRWRSHVRVCRASASSKSPYRKRPGLKHLDPRECSAPAGALVDTTLRAHRLVQPLIERRADVVYGSRFLSARPHRGFTSGIL